MTDLELARRTLDEGDLSFVLVRDQRILATGTDNGVRELLATVDRLGGQVRGASLADKVVGKAVAVIAIEVGLVAVDTRIGSAPAIELLKSRGVPVTVRTVVPQIMNRRNDGPCPMEHLMISIDDPHPALAALRQFFAARPA